MPLRSDIEAMDRPTILCSSYNPLPRTAGKIQYEAEAKLRPSNCILPETRESGLYLICTPLPWQQDKPCVKISISAECCVIIESHNFL